MYPCCLSHAEGAYSLRMVLFSSLVRLSFVFSFIITTPQASRLSFLPNSLCTHSCQWTNAQRRVHLAGCVCYSHTHTPAAFHCCLPMIHSCNQALEELIPDALVKLRANNSPQLSQYDVWIHDGNIIGTSMLTLQAFSTTTVHNIHTSLLDSLSLILSRVCPSRSTYFACCLPFLASKHIIPLIPSFHSHRSTLPHSRETTWNSPHFYFTHSTPAKILLIQWPILFILTTEKIRVTLTVWTLNAMRIQCA